jgi:pantoate--beta-alanine ligase
MPLTRQTDPDATRAAVAAWHAAGLTVGFVPTMGALHDGHLSLIRCSAAECDRTVVSIYVNPTQFAPTEDLDAYPRRLDDDCAIAESSGADLVFCPSDRSMYPDGFATFVTQEGLTQALEGEFRPTHFQGVLTVVCKLLNIVPADRAYFGRKDFQQTVVVTRMVRDLNMPTEIRVMPTVREPDGLAMSSRNSYLSDEERRQAVCLSAALKEAARMYRAGCTEADELRRAMREVIAASPDADPDYVEVVDADSLAPVAHVDARAVAVLAVRIGTTRLIDNMAFAEPLEG